MKESDIYFVSYNMGPGKSRGHRVVHIPSGKYVEDFSGKEQLRQKIERLRKELSDLVPPEPYEFKSFWLTSTVKQIAQAIDEECAFERMPVFADALEDAGCDNADILDHCRKPGDHVRGCWVVDLVLGKE